MQCILEQISRLQTQNRLALLRGQGGKAEIGLDGAEAREELLGLFILYDRGDNDVVTGNPVDGGGDLVLVAGLQRVDDA